jgi:TonB family protein
MGITFRDAIAISMVIHAAVLTPLFSGNPPTHVVCKKDSIIIDYVKIETLKASMPETQKTAIVPKVEMRKSTVSGAVQDKASGQAKIADELAAKRAKIRATEDYINYYQLIREKTRRVVKDRYLSFYGEGDVRLVFALRRDGSLISVDVDRASSSGDRVLLATAIQCLKEASPFAPFPKTLDLRQMTFTLTVSFKKR